MSTPGAELHMKDEFVGLVTNFTEVADLFDSLLSLVKAPRDKGTVLRLKFREIKRRLEAIKCWAEDSPEPASEFVTTVLYLRRTLSPPLYSLCKCIPDLTEVISSGSGTNSRESSTPLEARHWDGSARLLETAAEFEGALDPFHPLWRRSWRLITYFTPRLKLVQLEEVLKVEMVNRKHSDGASKIFSLFVEDEQLFPKLLSAMVDLNRVAFGGLQNTAKNRPSLLSAFHRVTRPEIRKEWARIEWQCDCGELLYGDYRSNEEPLKALAETLNGTVEYGSFDDRLGYRWSWRMACIVTLNGLYQARAFTPKAFAKSQGNGMIWHCYLILLAPFCLNYMVHLLRARTFWSRVGFCLIFFDYSALMVLEAITLSKPGLVIFFFLLWFGSRVLSESLRIYAENDRKRLMSQSKSISVAPIISVGKEESSAATSHSTASSDGTNANPSLPAPAHLPNSTSTVREHQGGAAGLNLKIQAEDSKSSRVIADTSTSANELHQRSRKRYIELCLKKRSRSHLNEIDISGPQTDRELFRKLRTRYEHHKSESRSTFFGRLPLRRPDAGYFVQFILDISPAVANLRRDCIPPEEEVRAERWKYSPVPLTEPPMDAQTFLHYLQKDDPRHDRPRWCTRFPLKLDESVLFSPDKLTEAWGVEISEGPNWRLFVGFMLMILLLSGAVAATSAVLMEDRATGVAIGAWLTAVQTLTAMLVFYFW